MARALAGRAGARRGARAQAQRGPGAVGVGQWGGAAAAAAVLLATATAGAQPAGASGVTSGEAFGKALAKDDPRKAYLQVSAGPSPRQDARTPGRAPGPLLLLPSRPPETSGRGGGPDESRDVSPPRAPAGPSGTERTALTGAAAPLSLPPSLQVKEANVSSAGKITLAKPKTKNYKDAAPLIGSVKGPSFALPGAGYKKGAGFKAPALKVSGPDVSGFQAPTFSFPSFGGPAASADLPSPTSQALGVVAFEAVFAVAALGAVDNLTKKKKTA